MALSTVLVTTGCPCPGEVLGQRGNVFVLEATGRPFRAWGDQPCGVFGSPQHGFGSLRGLGAESRAGQRSSNMAGFKQLGLLQRLIAPV